MDKKIYIAGPITSRLSTYKAEFMSAEKRLRNMGYSLIMNPAVLPLGFEYEDYMNITAAMLKACDIIVLLEGWETSDGCQRECALAKELDKTILVGLNEAEELIEGKLCTL